MTHNDDGALPPETQFGANVRQAREARGWTQETLARRLRDHFGLDLHQTAIARLEVGKRAITLNEAVALAQVLVLGLDEYVTPDVNLSPEDIARYEEAVETMNGKLFAAARELAEIDERRRSKRESLDALRRAQDMTQRQIETAKRRLGARADG